MSLRKLIEVCIVYVNSLNLPKSHGRLFKNFV